MTTIDDFKNRPAFSFLVGLPYEELLVFNEKHLTRNIVLSFEQRDALAWLIQYRRREREELERQIAANGTTSDGQAYERLDELIDEVESSAIALQEAGWAAGALQSNRQVQSDLKEAQAAYAQCRKDLKEFIRRAYIPSK